MVEEVWVNKQDYDSLVLHPSKYGLFYIKRFLRGLSYVKGTLFFDSLLLIQINQK